MQVKRGPTIPKKPHYLSNFDPEVNKNAPDTVKESATTQHSSLRQTDFTPTQSAAPTPLRDKQTYNSNGQNLNTKTPHKPPRRRKPTLTIQHLTLYSSSSPINLLASTNNINNNDTTTNSSSSTNFGRQRASSSLQQSSQIHSRKSSDGPPTKPRRPSAPQMTSPDGYFKPSHTSQWDFDLFEQQQRNIAKDNAKTAGAGISDSKPAPMGSFKTSTPPTSLPSQQDSRPTQAPPTNSNSKYDGMIAQLVEMGFDAKDAEAAVKSSKDFTIQSCLDLLVQGMSSSTRGGNQKPQHAAFGSSTTASNRPSPPSFSTTTAPVQPQMESKAPSSFSLGKKQQQSQGTRYGEPDDTSSSDEDDILSNDQEWQRQQEARRRDYLESVKQEQQRQQQEHMRLQQQQEELRKQQLRQEQLRKQQEQQEQLRKQQQQQQEQQEQLRKEQEQLRKEQEQLRKQQQQQHQEQRQQKENRPSFDDSPYTKSASGETPFVSRPTQHPRTSTSSSRASTPSGFDTAPTTKPIGPDMIKKAVKARTRGNDLFKLGYYSEAEKSYNQALAILPDRHDITAIVTNNRAAARLKNGQYQSCVTDCGFVIEWVRLKSTSECQTMVVLDGDITVRWYEQIGKALHRKAEALEKMTLVADAQLVYEELIKMDGGDTKARKGLERCQPPTKPPPPPRRTPAATSKPAPPARPQQQTASAFPGLDYSIFEINKVDEPPPSKAVAAMRARQAEIAKEDNERMEKADLVNAQIDRWKKGREKNLRALLSSLDTLLWPGAQWRGAPINELLEPKKVKICYMKAIAKVHPDKLPASTTVEQKLLASGIFSVLNQAWDDFRSTNKI